MVDLATEEGDGQLRGIRVRALNAVTVALAQVIATASPSPEGGPAGATCSPAGADPMAVAGTLVAMFASVSAHRYGFEFWGIRTAQPHRHAGPHPALGRHRAAGSAGGDPAA